MNDEQTTSGDSLNPAAATPAPRPAVPITDVVPPQNESLVEPEVVTAPPEDAILPVSDEIAEQIAADANPSPAPVEAPAPSPEPAAPATEAPAPTEEASTEELPAKSDEQTSAVHEEIKKQEQTQAHEIPELPKVPNPGRGAAIVVVLATVLLAAAAVFAYMSTQN